jgi:hypothetical protein
MKRLLVALTALAVGIVALLALSNSPTQAGSVPPTVPQCDADDQVLAMDATRNGKGPGSSPEDAVEKEVRSTYPNLPASAFRRSHDEGDSVELVHERGGRVLVVVGTENVEGGWGVEHLMACNKVLTEPGGRSR